MSTSAAGRLSARDPTAPSVFTAANLLREARRQRRLPALPVPAVCLLDPDGDVVRHLAAARRAERHPGWACYHSELWVTRAGGHELGIVGCAVGAPYAVLVAEQLDHLDEPIHRGASWTTDAPFRETAAALASAKAAGVHAVEMEAAGLYAFAAATNRRVVCIANVTNTMAVHGDDFEKGAADGTHRILAVTAAIADRLG